MNHDPLELLIATSNAGKLRELKVLLAGLPFCVKGLGDIQVAEVEETGATFAENAELKAAGYARQTGIWAFADDSGLEVEALKGAPGVFSARYGGPHTDYTSKMQLLLAAIKNAEAGRHARFVCAIAVADPSGRIKAAATGVCRGTIAAIPSGSGGFGYDPIFIPNGYEQTFGELPGSIKSKISHRARAYDEILPFLRGLT